MPRQMHVLNNIRGDHAYLHDRVAARNDELVAATERGERDRCPKCSRVAVGYSYEGTDDQPFVLAECSECGWQGA